MNNKIKSKLIVLGDSAVGKTSLLNCYVDQKFLRSYKATVGADFMYKEVIIDGKIISLEIWDTAGQQKFRSLGSAFYRSSDCCVLVYDVTQKESFEHIEQWIKEFIKQGSPQQPENFPFILIGNKADKLKERQVSEEEIHQFLAKHPKIRHFNTSAKDNEGVSVAFENAALASIENKTNEIFIPLPKFQKLLNEKDIKNKEKKKKSLC